MAPDGPIQEILADSVFGPEQLEAIVKSKVPTIFRQMGR